MQRSKVDIWVGLFVLLGGVALLFLALKAGNLGIVEVFNRDRWPGKRAEFSTGNYNSINRSANVFYYFVV